MEAVGTDPPIQELPRAVDAVVVGGGHAGIEAAWALGRLGVRVLLVTFDAHALARMSCNPSIGGLAKGQLAREVDALGGLMGRLIDRTGIHFRMLNRSKGPAVRAPRAQADKQAYAREARRMLADCDRITILEGEVTDIQAERSRNSPGGFPSRRIAGVVVEPPNWSRVETGGAHSDGASVPPICTPPIMRVTTATEIQTRAVVLTVGTFLRARVFTGLDPRPGGRRGEPPAERLAGALARLGLQSGRLKTGTPPRLHRDTIDFSKIQVQPGDEPPPRFSFYDHAEPRNHVLCHLTRTNVATHHAIRAALESSPLYSGMIEGIGPRYCPSIEDKVARFPERTSHQVFLEPEGIDSEEVYPNGISTSLPREAQEAYVRTIRGLEEAQIVHPGYAVEYDFLLTSQIDGLLGVRNVEGLFAAGQINGTSGYEEAAAQGIVAGINAQAFLAGRAPVQLMRNQAYMGVLIDDLVTKVPTEPYRMFTSQAEYRLILRQDNADKRLRQLGQEIGLLSEEDCLRTNERWARVESALGDLKTRRVRQSDLDTAADANTSDADTLKLSARDLGRRFGELLKRPEVTLDQLTRLGFPCHVPESDAFTIEAEIKYEGYIQKQAREVARTRALEDQVIPAEMLASPPREMAAEAREKLNVHRPRTLGQALRIPGVTPNDVFILSVRMRRR